jgi:hypothetical protein
MSIVRFALRFPYTFYVAAALILFLGVSAIAVMPTASWPASSDETPGTSLLW